MEVHHHSHSSRKKWTHYFWEFFMLFLAVTLGFFVENAREHYIEHKREKQFIVSLIEDLKEDTTSFNSVIRSNEKACLQIDTLFSLLKGNNPSAEAKHIYYLARLIPLSDPNMICQDKTFEQLKGSGGLRLIRGSRTQNMIGAYYQINKLIKDGPSPMQFQNRRDLFLGFDEIFDAGTMQSIMKTEADTAQGSSFILLNESPPAINRFCMRYHIMYSTKKVVSRMAKGFINQAQELINYLSGTYHIK